MSRSKTPPPSSASSTKKIKAQRNISILKGILFFTLVFIGGLSGSLSYSFLSTHQIKTSENQFLIHTNDHYAALTNLLNIQLHLNLQFSVIMGLHCPEISDWPNCSLTSRELRIRTRSLLALSEVSQFGVSPIIKPSTRHLFENYANNYYQNDEGYQNKSNISLTIYELDSNGQQISSPNHTNSSKSQYDILVPIFLMSDIQNTNTYLFNTYSNPKIQERIDDSLNCVNSTTPSSNGDIQHQCSNTLDLPLPLSTEYSSVFMTPIFANDDTSTKLAVGFSVATFSWKSALSKTLPQQSSFQISIESSQDSSLHFYDIHDGEIKEVNKIHYDHKSNQFKKTFRFTSISSLESYTITYHSSLGPSFPLYAIFACTCCVGMTIVISIIFLSFISLMNRETMEVNMLLDSKRTYVRFISHEIRTPMNTIILSIRVLSENLIQLQELMEENLIPKTNQQTHSHEDQELELKKSSLIEESLELVTELEENAGVAIATLNDLINYDKIESKSFSIEKNDVNVWTVVEKTVHPLAFQAKEKNIQMNLTSQLTTPTAHLSDLNISLKNLRLVGDAIKLGQVVRNLVSNALKFTPIGGKINISVSFKHYDDPYTTNHFTNSQFQSPQIFPEDNLPVGEIILSVSDTGPGLTHEQQQAMFREGVQFNPNELQAGQGSGLGMWISKEIVTLHHGTISVYSKGLGCGTTFVVTLPVILRENLSSRSRRTPRRGDKVRQSQSLSEPRPSPLSTQRAPLHVLVVDDAPSNRKLVCRLLQSQGFICKQAENGQECLNMIQTEEMEVEGHPFDLILMDYEMPVMNGPTAAQKIREMKNEIPIIGLTGNVLPEDKEFFIKHGANHVLTKPVNINELLELIYSNQSLCGGSAV